MNDKNEKRDRISLEKIINTQVWNEYFKTPQQREKALMDLSVLQTQPGWILIERILNLHIEIVEKAILDDLLDPEDEKEKKQDRLYLKLFKQFPLFLIQLIQSSANNDQQIGTDDPFE